jgi:hypothetical protein
MENMGKVGGKKVLGSLNDYLNNQAFITFVCFLMNTNITISCI